MNGCRIGSLIRRTVSQFSIHRFVPFFGSCPANPRFSFFSNGTEVGSAAYRHARIFKKPTSVQFRSELFNSVSLMGVVDRPVRVLGTEPDRFGVFTMLRVKDPRDPSRSFRIFLQMWDGMAQKCIAHLKPNDLIYISGYLVSHSKSFQSRNSGLANQVKVMELSYVVPTSKGLGFRTSGESQSERVTGEDATERSKNRLYLWQVFFANPYEWWDNRKSKKSPRQPDFKHKDSGEALWLNRDDPPWIKRQLQLLDQSRADGARPHFRLSEWVYDE